MDYYSQRLEGYKKTKEDRLQKFIGKPANLPIKGAARPDGGTSSNLKTMASTPSDPNQQPQQPDSMFKNVFDNYNKDEGFKQVTNEFTTVMNAMKQDLGGLGLPEEILKKKVMGVIDQFRNKARGPQLEQKPSAMGGLTPQTSPMSEEVPNG